MQQSWYSQVTCVCVATTSLLALASPSSAHVTLLDPNGGEVLTVGSQFKVEWTIDIFHNQNNWDLWYSSTGGAGPWIPIAMDLPPGNTQVGSVHDYMWTIPHDTSNKVRVRVRMDNSGQDFYDISDGKLRIVPGCCGTAYCDPASPNSTGMPAILDGHGSDVVVDNALVLHAFQLPPNKSGYPLISATQGSNPVGSGVLCLSGTIGRYPALIFNSGAAGDSGLILLDLTNLPNAIGGSVMAGETWNFQVWYRDIGTSNFTNGLTVVFQ